MAIVANNDLTRGLRGRIGKWLVFRVVRGKTIASHAPGKPDPRKQSAAQRQTRSTFREASAWAVRILLDPAKKQYYADIATAQALPNAYTAAVREYMREVAAKRIEEQVPNSISTKKEANLDEQGVLISSSPEQCIPSETMIQNVKRPVSRLSKGICCTRQLTTIRSNYVWKASLQCHSPSLTSFMHQYGKMTPRGMPRALLPENYYHRSHGRRVRIDATVYRELSLLNPVLT
jgi:hypothetical protein